MRDEDFVLGYVTGYNDGVQSGGGSGGGKFDNIPLLKKYSFVGTDYGIGVVDVNNEMFDVPYNFPNWSVYEPDKVIFCPYPDGVSRRIRIAVLKNGKVVGLLMISNGDLRIEISYQYDPNTCVWNRVGTIVTEKIENVSVTVTEKIYNNGNYIEKKLVFGYDIEAIDIVSRRHPDVTILESNWWDVLPQSVIDKVFEDVPFPGWALEHAAVTETSLMMYLAPQLVRMDMIPTETGFEPVPYHKYPIVKGMVPESGALASAKGSSAEKGKLITDTAVDEFVKIIERFM